MLNQAPLGHRLQSHTHQRIGAFTIFTEIIDPEGAQRGTHSLTSLWSKLFNFFLAIPYDGAAATLFGGGGNRENLLAELNWIHLFVWNNSIVPLSLGHCLGIQLGRRGVICSPPMARGPVSALTVNTNGNLKDGETLASQSHLSSPSTKAIFSSYISSWLFSILNPEKRFPSFLLRLTHPCSPLPSLFTAFLWKFAR